MTAYDDWAANAYAAQQAEKDRKEEIRMGGVVTGLWMDPNTGNVVIEYEEGNAGLVLVEPDSSSVVILDEFTPHSGYHKLV